MHKNQFLNISEVFRKLSDISDNFRIRIHVINYQINKKSHYRKKILSQFLDHYIRIFVCYFLAFVTKII